MKRDPLTSNACVLSARPACYMSGLLLTNIRFFSQDVHICKETYIYEHIHQETYIYEKRPTHVERWGAGVETPKNVRSEVGGWGRVPVNEPYAPSLSTIYDGA